MNYLLIFFKLCGLAFLSFFGGVKLSPQNLCVVDADMPPNLVAEYLKECTACGDSPDVDCAIGEDELVRLEDNM